MPGTGVACWRRVAELALLAGAAGGCGGKAADASPLPPPSASLAPAAPASSTSRPPRAPMPEVAPVRPPEMAPTVDVPDTDQTSAYFIQDAARNVLLANCAQCHGPAVRLPAPGGINFIDDLDRLVATGLIIPLSSATSPIVIVMRNGSMPPASSGLPSLTEADIDVVVTLIDSPRYWPDVPAAAGADAGSSAAALDAGGDAG